MENRCPSNIQWAKTCEPVRSCALNGHGTEEDSQCLHISFDQIEFACLRRIIRHQVRVYPIRFCSHFATAWIYKYKYGQNREKKKRSHPARVSMQFQQITFLSIEWNTQFNENQFAANEYNYSNSIFIIFRIWVCRFCLDDSIRNCFSMLPRNWFAEKLVHSSELTLCVCVCMCTAPSSQST